MTTMVSIGLDETLRARLDELGVPAHSQTLPGLRLFVWERLGAMASPELTLRNLAELIVQLAESRVIEVK